MCGGTRLHILCPSHRSRSIPACAGEPSSRVKLIWRLRSIPACAGELPGYLDKVYPRVCGGTPAAGYNRASPSGLSPRVRGEPSRQRQKCLRSIPACAGEPASFCRSGAVGSIPACAGEPLPFGDAPQTVGSIPACAGEPSAGSTLICQGEGLSPRVRGNQTRTAAPVCEGVYPRVCGGTASRPGPTLTVYPRVCGGTSGLRNPCPQPGSIPACAGEPLRVIGPGWRALVYPRVCGGTTPLTISAAPTGSIPACAGEPAAAGGAPALLQGSIPACAGETPTGE